MTDPRNKALAIFQLPPCDQNEYISYSEEKGRIAAYTRPGGNEGLAQARDKMLKDYDELIKKEYGSEHFHGEDGLPIAAPIRQLLDL